MEIGINLPEPIKLDWQNTFIDLSRDYAALLEINETQFTVEPDILARTSESFLVTTSLTKSFSVVEADETESEEPALLEPERETESFSVVESDETQSEEPALFEQERKMLTETLPRQTQNRLDFLLNILNPDLLILLQGAEAALVNKELDYPRHFSTSLRELFTHTLHQIAPDEAIQTWSQDERDYLEGKPTSKARLRFLLRDVKGNKEFEKFLENDIIITLDYFLPLFQTGIHTISVPYTDDQLKMMLLKMQGLLVQLLEIWYASTQRLAPKSLQTKNLNIFLSNLPELGEDTANFAQDVQRLRSLPTEQNSWVTVHLPTAAGSDDAFFPEEISMNPPRKILFLASAPEDQIWLRTDKELREVKTALQQTRHHKSFQWSSHHAVRPADLRRALLAETPDIVHFSGHGEAGGILLENEQGQAQSVAVTALADLFGYFADKLQCVVLNACFSESQAQAISAYVEYVVGMRHDITDQAARHFAVGFYDALAHGKDIPFAFNLAQNAIQLEGMDSGSPILLSNPKIEQNVAFPHQLSGNRSALPYCDVA